MKKHIAWLAISGMMVLSVLAASCAPTTQANPTTSAPTTTAPTTSSPTKTTTPTTTAPTTATGPEMASISLKKLDGTTVTKQVEKPKYGGQITLVRNNSITGWDEAYAANPWVGSGQLDPHMEELLQGDFFRGPAGTGEVSWQLSGLFDINYRTGMVAESWEIKPPDTLIFHIRKGVRFSLNPALEASRLVGGRELKASDVAWNIKRVFMDIKTAGIYTVSGPSRPLDVSAPDDYTVIVKTPPGDWRTFEVVVDWMRIYPPEVAQKYGNFDDWTRSIGTHAFMLTDYVAMSSATYARNTNYWGKDPMFPENQLPYADKLKILIIPDPSTRLSAIRTGKIDEISAISWEDAASLKKTNPELLYSRYLGGARIPTGRQDKPELPFKDINVRRALMMAINLQEIKDSYDGGEAEILAFMVPPLKEWEKAYTPLDQIGLAKDGFDTRKVFEYNPDEARKLLAAAGYPNGFKTEIVLNATQVDLASMVKEYWIKIGVDLFLDVKETGVFESIRVRKTFNQMFFHGISNIGVANTMDTARSGGGYNLSMVSDPEVEERYNKMAALEPRSDAWWKQVKDNNLYEVHSVNYFTLPQPYLSVFWQPWLKRHNGEVSTGVWNANGGWTKYAWIDQDLKKSMGN